MSDLGGKTDVEQTGSDFGFWHLTDMAVGLGDVRFRGDCVAQLGRVSIAGLL
jgi:hypothetical protein